MLSKKAFVRFNGSLADAVSADVVDTSVPRSDGWPALPLSGDGDVVVVRGSKVVVAAVAGPSWGSSSFGILICIRRCARDDRRPTDEPCRPRRGCRTQQTFWWWMLGLRWDDVLTIQVKSKLTELVTSDQSQKRVNYESRVRVTRKLPTLQLYQES